jgi:hypothetical protein
VARGLAISTAIFFTMIAALWAAGVTPTQSIAWNLSWLLTNLGLIKPVWSRSTRVVSRRALTRQEALIAAALFCGCYTVYWVGAVFVVPLQVDHDLEVQGTGYGLLTRFEPLLLTDRGTVHFFAHPPLLHFYVAGSFLLHGALPDLEFFDTASRRALAARAGAEGGTGQHSVQVELDAIYRRYGERPHKLESRTPNLLFASVTVALLGVWAGRIARRWWAGPLAAVSYASSPEVFVRSSYGGYFAIGGLAIILMLLAVEAQRRRRAARHTGLAAFTGGWAALSDHKLVLLPAALVISGEISRWTRRAISASRESFFFHPLIIGFALGMAIFWAFGLWWAPATFLKDHLRDHLLDRIAHQNPLGYVGYPRPLALWNEFLRHTGFVVVPVGLLVLTWDTLRSTDSERQGEPLRGFWLSWVLLTAAAYTAVDWRMTKHLAPILLVVNLALVPSRGAPVWRWWLAALVWMFTIVWNIAALVTLSLDFANFVVTPGW